MFRRLASCHIRVCVYDHSPIRARSFWQYKIYFVVVIRLLIDVDFQYITCNEFSCGVGEEGYYVREYIYHVRQTCMPECACHLTHLIRMLYEHNIC